MQRKESLEAQSENPYFNKSIEDQSSFLNKLFFWWTNQIVEYGSTHTYTENNIFDCPQSYKYDVIVGNTERLLKEVQKETGEPNIQIALWRQTKWNIFFVLLFLIPSNLLNFAGPLLMQKILENFYEKNDDVYNQGYYYAIGMFLAYILRSIFQQHGFHFVNQVGFQSLAGCQSQIFKKILRLSTSSRSFLETGQIINLAYIDSFAVLGFSQYGAFTITAPITIVVALALILSKVGAVGLIGIVVIFSVSVINIVLTQKMTKLRKDELVFSDKRAKYLAEYFAGIRLIKYFGWENYCIDIIMQIRDKETNIKLKSTIIRSLIDFVINVVPILISISVFGLYVLFDNELSPSLAFTVLSLFNLLLLPLRIIGFVAFGLAQLITSFRRMNQFMKQYETQGYSDVKEVTDREPDLGEIFIKDGEFVWATDETKALNEKFTELSKKKQQPQKVDDKNKKQIDIKNQVKKDEKELQDLKKDEQDKKGDSDKKDDSVKKDDSIKKEQIKKTTEPVLQNINLHVKKGEFLGIIGIVGSGKSSLVSAILGELFRTKGAHYTHGSISYVGQTAWLQNATLRENILFGQPYDEKKYNQVIQMCELVDDIKVLQGGDMVEIGEKGINLSGGQKQRVSLARAAYSNADIYIIDDALSALDAHVGKNIYDNFIIKFLKGKTIIFVTHALKYVDNCDRIAVLKNKQIIELDTPVNLRNNKQSEFNILNMTQENNQQIEDIETFKKRNAQRKDALFKNKPDQKQDNQDVSQINSQQEIQEQQNQQQRKKSDQIDLENKKLELESKNEKDGKLTFKEKQQHGAVPITVFIEYMKSGGTLLWYQCIFMFIISRGATAATSLWLGAWANRSWGLTQGQYIYIYALLSLGQGLLILYSGICFNYFAKKSSFSLQQDMLTSVFRSPMSWFDAVPTGRILNRCTKDQDEVDQQLPWTLSFALQNLSTILTSLLLGGFIVPIFLIFVIIAFPIFLYYAVKFVVSSREMKRIESISRSPAMAIISESCSGYVEIRSYRQIQRFQKQFENSFNNYIKASYNGQSAGRWVSLRTDLFSSFCLGVCTVLIISSREWNYTKDPSMMGVALTSILNIISSLAFTIKLITDCEVQMSCVQRIREYTNKPEQEASWDLPKALDQWPQDSTIEAKNIVYRYRENLPTVIKNISFSVKNSEKIGVVGRTGSGKSTLTLGLLRILELAENDEGQVGTICLSNQQIDQIGLHQLRQKVTIVPQDPILFSGSLRSNIDPFNQHEDQKIVDALKKVTIWNQIKSDDDDTQQREDAMYLKSPLDKEDRSKLYMTITTGGGNFSLGQRQLICLARALVRGSKFLLMDEATASIDELTDHLIQKMIKTEFKDTTVFTIAHRLNTIVQYDRILVLADGKIMEFDTPLNLMNKKDGVFQKMIADGGHSYEQKMRMLAENKDNLEISDLLDKPVDVNYSE